MRTGLEELKNQLSELSYRKALVKIKTFDDETFFGYLKNINDISLVIENDRSGYTFILRLDQIKSCLQLTPFEAEVR